MDRGSSLVSLSGPAKLLFWLSSAIVAYTWVGYPLLLRLLLLLHRKPRAVPEAMPSASIVLVVHNEEAVVREALDDLLALEYPRELLEIIVVSDGSTDRTNEIVREYARHGVRLLPVPRVGHTAGVAQGVASARHEVIIRTDADTRHNRNYLRCLLRHYAEPRVGCVGGRFSFRNEGETGITRNEGLYWRYEMALRKAESDLGVLSTTSGAVMSFRRHIFEPFSHVYSEDVVIPKLVVNKGYRVIQEPDAVAYEVMPQTIEGEFAARRRMVARGVTGLLSTEGALSPTRHPGHWASIMSHKLLRWSTPVFLLASFAGSVATARHKLYAVAACCHLGLYTAALLGYALERRNKHLRPLSAAFSFCLANVGFLVGLWEALRGRRISAYGSQK